LLLFKEKPKLRARALLFSPLTISGLSFPPLPFLCLLLPLTCTKPHGCESFSSPTHYRCNKPASSPKFSRRICRNFYLFLAPPPLPQTEIFRSGVWASCIIKRSTICRSLLFRTRACDPTDFLATLQILVVSRFPFFRPKVIEGDLLNLRSVPFPPLFSGQ